MGVAVYWEEYRITYFIICWCTLYHLGRADPDCALGHLLKTLFRNDEFMDKLVNSYIMSALEEFDLNCIAARVLLNAMPGLESAAVFQDMVSLGEYTISEFL